MELKTAIQEIKERTNIKDFAISKGLQLKKSGHNQYKGLCPFHSEKTSSFVIHTDTERYYCYGSCKEGGDVISLLQKLDDLSLIEAVKILANEQAIEIDTQPNSSYNDTRNKRLYNICKEASELFHKALHENTKYKDYLKARGVSFNSLNVFKLGFGCSIVEHFKTTDYTEQELIDAGLLVKHDKYGILERFKNRLIFPIFDRGGNVVSFNGRDINNAPRVKYMNGPETPIFSKGKTLYGLNISRKAIRDSDMVIVVEGCFDLILAYQNGLEQVVATLGTSLTDSHIELIKKLTDNLVLCFDNDKAGNNSVIKAINTVTKSNQIEFSLLNPKTIVQTQTLREVDVSVLTLPDGFKDLGELLCFDGEAWRTIVENRKPILDFYLKVAANYLDLKIARNKTLYVNKFAPLILALPDPIQKEHYCKRIAKICELELDIVKLTISKSLIKEADTKNRLYPVKREFDNKVTNFVKLENTTETHLIYLLGMYPNECLGIEAIDGKTVNEHDFEIEYNRMLFEVIRATRELPIESDNGNIELSKYTRQVSTLYADEPMLIEIDSIKKAFLFDLHKVRYNQMYLAYRHLLTFIGEVTDMSETFELLKMADGMAQIVNSYN